MTTSIRAELFIDYMEREFGWQCYDTTRYCTNCERASFSSNVQYCGNCGTILPSLRDNIAQGIAEVEEGFQYAFGEPNKTNT